MLNLVFSKLLKYSKIMFSSGAMLITLVGCSSLTVKENPQQAVASAMNNTLSGRGFSFETQTNFEQLRFTNLESLIDSKTETVTSNQYELDEESPEESANKAAIAKNYIDWLSFIFENISISTQGFADFQTQRFEIIPEISYKSSLTDFKQRYPMQLDLKNKRFLIDTLLLAPHFTQLSKRNSVTAIDIEKYIDKVNAVDVLKAYQQTLSSYYWQFEAEQFSAAENSSRSVNLSLSLNEYIVTAIQSLFIQRETFIDSFNIPEQDKQRLLSEFNAKYDVTKLSRVAGTIIDTLFSDTSRVNIRYDFDFSDRIKAINTDMKLYSNSRLSVAFEAKIHSLTKLEYPYEFESKVITADKPVLPYSETAEKSIFSIIDDTIDKYKEGTEL